MCATRRTKPVKRHTRSIPHVCYKLGIKIESRTHQARPHFYSCAIISPKYASDAALKAISTIIRGLIALLFIYYLAAFIWSVAGRIAYPYELEYSEGSTYLHTQRLLEGKQLYVSPDEGFVPFPYSPLYYAAVIPFTWIAGQNIIAGRLASIISLAFIGLLIWLALYQSTRSKLAGLFAFGMFLAFYYIGGAWLDVCRIDVFLCAMFVGTVYFLKDFPKSKRGLLLSAVFLVASVFTKQVGIVLPLFIFPFLYTRERKSACIYFLGVLASIAIIAGILNAVSGGWFWHYIYKVPQGKPFEIWRFINVFLMQDILGKIPILFAGSILWVFVRNKVAGKRTPLNIWEWTLPAAFLASALPRSQQGGYENDLLLLTLWCSIMFGFFLYHLPGYFERLLGTAETEEGKRHWAMWRLAAYNFLLAQLILIFYIPTATGFPRRTDSPIIPTAIDRKAGDNLVNYIRSFPGEVYLPTQDYYALLAGKTPNLIIMAAIEYMRTRSKQPDLIYAQINSHYFDAIIVNDPLPPRREAYSFERVILDNYYWAGNVQYEDEHAFLPTTGLWTRPNIVLLPLEVLPGIEGRLMGPPVRVSRDGATFLACYTDKGHLYLIDPDKFSIIEDTKALWAEGGLIGATNDGRLALLDRCCIYLVNTAQVTEKIKLPVMEYPPAPHQASIDPLGEFAVVADNAAGELAAIAIPSGKELGRWRIGSPIGRILITPTGDKLYTTTGESFSSIHKSNPNYSSLYRFDINRNHGSPLLNLAWTLDQPHHGRELRLSPDGAKLYWFDPKTSAPIGVFDAESPRLMSVLRNRGWRVVDIGFGDEPGKIFVHYAMADCNGVAALDADEDYEYGRARLYDRPGWIVPQPDGNRVLLFSAGTGRIIRFEIYPNDAWPGEQGFKPGT